MITLGHLHKDAIHLLSDVSDSARLDAELLIAYVLDIPRSRFITEPETPIDTDKLATVQKFLQRRRQGYPIAYLLGQKHFWDLELTVTPDTLIPRPETELLVETALTLHPQDKPIQIVDLGTGSGAIAIAIAKARPAWHVLATDRSAPALQVAQQNARQYKLNNIVFETGDWFAAIPAGQHFDVVISNPPYVCDDDPHLQRGDVQFEPLQALRAGADGLDDIRRIVSQAQQYLTTQGWLMLEHGYDQAADVKTIFEQHHYTSIQHKQDLAGHIRMTMGQRANG